MNELNIRCSIRRLNPTVNILQFGGFAGLSLGLGNQSVILDLDDVAQLRDLCHEVYEVYSRQADLERRCAAYVKGCSPC